MRSSSLLVSGCVALITTAGAAWCRQEASQSADPNRIQWALAGEARLRPEYRDDADLDTEEDDDTRFGFSRLRVGLEVKFKEAYRLFVQAQDSRIAGEEASTASNEKNLDLHQGYLEVKPTSTGRLALQLGRQEMIYGDERLIGAFGWDNVGRSFDAVRVRYAKDRSWIDGFVARLANRVSGAATTGSDLYGAYAHTERVQGTEYEAYLLSFQDSVAAVGEGGDTGDSAVHAMGARVREKAGPFDALIEGAAETGRRNDDDQRGWAFGAQAGWTLGDTAKTRLFAGYDFATGDEDPVDGESDEFFNFFPTNHPHYGSMDYEGWRNIRSPYGGASVTAGRHFARAAFHRFLLEEEAGPWKSAGGAVLGFDPSGESGTHVGGEIDLTWRMTLPRSFWVETGVSRFVPSNFARRTRGDDPSWWGYVMLTWRFTTS